MEKYDKLVDETIPDLGFQLQEMKWEHESKRENTRKEAQLTDTKNQKKILRELQEMNNLILAYGIRCLKKDMMLKVIFIRITSIRCMYIQYIYIYMQLSDVYFV